MSSNILQIKYFITGYNFFIQMNGVWSDLATLEGVVSDVQTALDNFITITYEDSEQGSFFKVASTSNPPIEYLFQVIQSNVDENKYIIKYEGVV